MKVAVILLLAACDYCVSAERCSSVPVTIPAVNPMRLCAYCVSAERCSSVADCNETSCATTAQHAHVQCIERHCTCSMDKLPCLSATDCSAGKCFDRDGHSTKWHCLDSSCICIRV